MLHDGKPRLQKPSLLAGLLRNRMQLDSREIGWGKRFVGESGYLLNQLREMKKLHLSHWRLACGVFASVA